MYGSKREYIEPTATVSGLFHYGSSIINCFVLPFVCCTTHMDEACLTYERRGNIHINSGVISMVITLLLGGCLLIHTLSTMES